MALTSKRPTATREKKVSQIAADVTGEDKKVRLNVEMPTSKRAALKVAAANEGRSIGEIINDLVDDYLSK